MVLKNNRRKTDDNKFARSVAYDQVTKDSKLDRLIVVYDEASILLFEKPRSKTGVKKI